MAKPKKKEQEPYGGKYSNIMEGEYLVKMREAIEKLAAGKINKKQYNEVKEDFLNEFPASAIKLLQADIDSDKAKKEKKSGMNESAKKSSLSGYYLDVSKKGVKVKKGNK